MRHFSCRALQSYNSPGDWASELFKPSTDSASLVVKIEKKNFSFRVWAFLGPTSKVGVFLRYFGHLCLAPGSVPMSHFWTQSFVENCVKIRVYRAFDWLSSISAGKSMAHKLNNDQNFAPSKSTLGGISPQAITRRQIKVDRYSNPLNSCRYVVCNKKKRFSLGCRLFFNACVMIGCLCFFLVTSAFFPDLPLRPAGAI